MRRSVSPARLALPALIVVLSVGGYLVASRSIRHDRDASTARRAQLESVRTRGILNTARAYVVGLANALAGEPTPADRRFAQLQGSAAGSVGLTDALWVEQVPVAGRAAYERRLGAPITRPAPTGGYERAPDAASYLPATFVTGTRQPRVRRGIDLASSPALAAALRNRASVFAVTATRPASLAGRPGFFLLQAARFGRGPGSRGFLVVFVPRGWLTLGLADDPSRVAVTLAGQPLEGRLGGTSAASDEFDALARHWKVAVHQEAVSGLRSTLPWVALGWPLVAAALGYALLHGLLRRRRAEREVERVFDLSLDLLGIANFQGYFVRVNPAFERILGYSSAEIMSRPFAELIHPEDRAVTNATMTSLARGEKVVGFENRYLRADGSVVWLQWSTTPVIEEGLVYGTARDITEGRRADEELREAQRMVEASRDELRVVVDEQAALRRVATLVARGGSPREVFDAVTTEVARLLDADATRLVRHESEGAGTIMAAHGHPAEAVATVEAPITVEGRPWGAMVAAWSETGPSPEAQNRMTQFTELVATAIANAESHEELGRLADGQAALRRIATLVAQGAAPERVLAAVTEEVHALLASDMTTLQRFDADGTATVLAIRGSRVGDESYMGFRWDPGASAPGIAELRVGRPARVDDFTGATGTLGEVVRAEGLLAWVAAPITVDALVRGMLVVGSRSGPLPEGTERRLGEFAEIVGTAISNAESRAELAASRARVVAAADETRRRIERDLHDGTQQRLISLALALRATESKLPAELNGIRAELSRTADGLTGAVEDLQEISRGIHPAILARGGLGPALKALARRAVIPVELHLQGDPQLAQAAEVAAYYVVSEALTNAAKHAEASHVSVDLEVDGSDVRIVVRDDGTGGADPRRGSGLVGLRDRVEALGGTIEIASPPGRGTALVARIPLEAPLEPPERSS